jgi:hypothetical protein
MEVRSKHIEMEIKNGVRSRKKNFHLTFYAAYITKFNIILSLLRMS